MFCKICENFMDITNNVSVISGKTKQDGGGSLENDLEENLEDEFLPEEISLTIGGGNKKQDSSSDFDISSINGGSETLSDNDLSGILEGNDIDIKNFNMTDLEKNPNFNKLSSNQKTLIINRILEKLPKNFKQFKSADVNAEKQSYFYCKSCGYYEKIPNKMFIFSKGNENNDDMYNYRFLNYKHDDTIPRTKKYNCINNKCPTHKNDNVKLAIFYRQKGSYNTRYVCTVCESFWNTFIEK